MAYWDQWLLSPKSKIKIGCDFPPVLGSDSTPLLDSSFSLHFGLFPSVKGEVLLKVQTVQRKTGGASSTPLTKLLPLFFTGCKLHPPRIGIEATDQDGHIKTSEQRCGRRTITGSRRKETITNPVICGCQSSYTNSHTPLHDHNYNPDL